MPIKLDLGKAWETAMALLSANKSVVLIMAGVFFFLPSAITTIATPEPVELNAMIEAGPGANPQAIGEAFLAYLGNIWWILLLSTLVTVIGTLGLLALLRHPSRPTVGEAIGLAAGGLPTAIGVTLLTLLIALTVVIVPALLGALISPLLAGLFYFIGIVVAVYFSVKFSLTSPIIAIEGVRNPVTALTRSWKLTKGNSLRLFAFYLLLGICIIVLGLIFGLVMGLFSVLGDQIGLFFTAVGSALFGMAYTSVFIAVIAAVHQQLSGGTAPEVRDTFE